MFKEATKMQQTKTGDWMPNGAMKSDFWERAECVFVCVSKTAYRFLFPWMRDGCRATVSNLVKKPHTSQSLIEECLTGSSNNSRLFLGNVWKKMKNGLNGFSDFQTFKNLLLIYFHIKKKKSMHSLSITPGLKTLCYYGNGHFLFTKDSPTSKLFVELQTGGTAT